MNFKWIDYPGNFEKEIETWCDEYAMQVAMDDDSAKVESQWYLANNTDQQRTNHNKIAMEGETPVALLMVVVIEGKNIVHFDTIIVNPALRNKGYGIRALSDLLHHAPQIIHTKNPTFVGQVHLNDEISIRLMKKLGFTPIQNEQSQSQGWNNWVFPPAAVERFYSFD